MGNSMLLLASVTLLASFARLQWKVPYLSTAKTQKNAKNMDYDGWMRGHEGPANHEDHEALYV